MKYQIVSDSSSNLLHMESFPYKSVPLHIIVGEKTFIDDDNLNIGDMYQSLRDYKGKTSTSCPSPDDWIQSFNEADVVFCVTITSGLSGSYSSANTAKHIYEEQHPDRNVFIFDSRSTGPEMVLIIEKIKELLEANTEPMEIYDRVCEYHKTIHLYYALASLDNLARNGRVSPIIAKGIGALGIRIVGTTTPEGTLKPVNKGRGDKKAMQKLVDYMKSTGYKGGKIIISHSNNPQAIGILTQLIKEKSNTTPMLIHENTGLCGYYAEDKSVLIGFETT